MNPTKITAVANVAGTLLSADNGRNGARIQNQLTSPIWVGKVNPPDVGAPSLYIAPCGTTGDPGWYTFDGTCTEAWYYITTGVGSFTVHTW
jgi:hypothetical protein